MIPTLTSEKYLEDGTKNIINKLTSRINVLMAEFPTDGYPKLSVEEENELKIGLEKQLGWGATGMEVPPLPESKRGLKFHIPALQLNSISHDIFEMRIIFHLW